VTSRRESNHAAQEEGACRLHHTVVHCGCAAPAHLCVAVVPLFLQVNTKSIKLSQVSLKAQVEKLSQVGSAATDTPEFVAIGHARRVSRRGMGHSADVCAPVYFCRSKSLQNGPCGLSGAWYVCTIPSVDDRAKLRNFVTDSAHPPSPLLCWLCVGVW